MRKVSGNSYIEGAQSPEVSLTLEHAQQTVNADNYKGEKDFHIMAHAGLVPNPWIGGLFLDEFVDTFVSKYGAENIEGGKVWLLVCLVGKKAILTQFLTRLSEKGVKNADVYAPNNFMWINSKGQPQVHSGKKGQEELEEIIRKYSAEIDERSDAQVFTVGEFADPGEQWYGMRLENGKITAIDREEVEYMVGSTYKGET